MCLTVASQRQDMTVPAVGCRNVNEPHPGVRTMQRLQADVGPAMRVGASARLIWSRHPSYYLKQRRQVWRERGGRLFRPATLQSRHGFRRDEL